MNTLLDEWINDPPSESEEEKDEVNSSGANKQIFSYGESTFSGSQNRSNDSQSSAMYHISSSDYHQSYEESKDKQVYNRDDLNKRKEQRKLETESNPFYIKGGSSNQKVC